MAVEAAKGILVWAEQNADYVWWGRGSRSGSFGDGQDVAGVKYNMFAVYTYGRIEIYFQYLANKPSFLVEAKRLELRDRLNAIDGVVIPMDALTKRPSIALDTLASAESQSQFLSVLDWALEEIKGHHEP